MYEKAGVLSITPSASAAEISKSGDFIFRTWSSDAGAAKTLYSYVSSKHKRIGVISEQTDYAQGFLKSLRDNNPSGAIEIINEDYLTENLDYRSIILKLRKSGVDGLFLNSQTEATFLAVLKQVRESGWSPNIYSAYWAGTSAVLSGSKNLVEGSYYVDLPSVSDVLTSEGKSLYEEFNMRTGGMQSIDLLFASTFEAFRSLHMAIESGKDMRQFLYTTSFDGLFGKWHFDKDGEIRGLNFLMKTVKDGKGQVLQD